MATCKQCQTVNDPNEKYCRKCGMQLNQVEAPTPGAESFSRNYSIVKKAQYQKSGLFANAGVKLRILAMINFVLICIIASIIVIEMMLENLVITGVITLIGGGVFAYLSSIMLYAFGELCENTRSVAYNTSHIKNQNN